MEVKRTVPVKLDVPDERRDDLHQTLQEFNTAANYTIDHGRDDDGNLILNKSTIHDEVYHDLRGETDLPANLVVRAYSKAVEAMKSTVAEWEKGNSRPLPSFDDLDSTDSMELELKFKESPKKTFDVSIVDEYERTDEGGYEDGNLGSEKRAEVRDLFREVVVDLYGDYIDEPALIEDKYGTGSLTDLKNIGNQIAERLVDKGFDSPERVFDADPEKLEEIEGIGKETAQDLAG